MFSPKASILLSSNNTSKYLSLSPKIFISLIPAIFNNSLFKFSVRGFKLSRFSSFDVIAISKSVLVLSSAFTDGSSISLGRLDLVTVIMSFILSAS
ncbi:MAG: Uncharacterised protein [Arcobacter lacus]|nr:MAG: Uncharacterised protein [Arcobacter lacus]